MKQLKRMQGALNDQPEEKPVNIPRDKFRTVPKLTKNKTNLLPALKLHKETKSSKSVVAHSKRSEVTKRAVNSEIRLTDRGVQTERPQDIAKLYERGTIIYPRKQDRKRGKRKDDHGDSISRDTMNIDEVTDKVENVELDEKNYIKGNIQALKLQSPKHEKEDSDKSKLPKNYQKGVVPKYLKNRKDDKQVESDPECPPGHVLLPDEERKETLRVLRQSKFAAGRSWVCFAFAYRNPRL